MTLEVGKLYRITRGSVGKLVLIIEFNEEQRILRWLYEEKIHSFYFNKLQQVTDCLEEAT